LPSLGASRPSRSIAGWPAARASPAGRERGVRGFLTWATAAGRVPRHLTPPKVAFQAGAALTQQQRLALLRRFLTDTRAPVAARAAACLLLLYAQPLTRIHRLAAADLTDAGGQMHLRLGDPPNPSPSRSPA
jgi:hypothetical protein